MCAKLLENETILFEEKIHQINLNMVVFKCNFGHAYAALKEATTQLIHLKIIPGENGLIIVLQLMLSFPTHGFILRLS